MAPWSLNRQGPSTTGPRARRRLWQLLLLGFVLTCLGWGFQNGTGNTPCPHVLIIDSGSSGTRMHAYEWCASATVKGGVPVLHSISPSAAPDKVPKSPEKGLYNRVETYPGLDKFAHDPVGLSQNALGPLIEWAKAVVPERQWASTPVFLFATAGVRKLAKADQIPLLQAICTCLSSSGFSFTPSWAQVIDGADEGMYSWVALNYVKGNFFRSALSAAQASASTLLHNSRSQEAAAADGHGDPQVQLDGMQLHKVLGGKKEAGGSATVGVLDLGGSSLEVTYAVQSGQGGHVQMNSKLEIQLAKDPGQAVIGGTGGTSRGGSSRGNTGNQRHGSSAPDSRALDLFGTHYQLATQSYSGFGLNDAFDRSVSFAMHHQAALGGQWPSSTLHSSHTAGTGGTAHGKLHSSRMIKEVHSTAAGVAAVERTASVISTDSSASVAPAPLKEQQAASQSSRALSADPGLLHSTRHSNTSATSSASATSATSATLATSGLPQSKDHSGTSGTTEDRLGQLKGGTDAAQAASLSAASSIKAQATSTDSASASVSSLSFSSPSPSSSSFSSPSAAFSGPETQTEQLPVVRHPCMHAGFNRTYQRKQSHDVAVGTLQVQLLGSYNRDACEALNRQVVMYRSAMCLDALPAGAGRGEEAVATGHGLDGRGGHVNTDGSSSSSRGSSGRREDGARDLEESWAKVLPKVLPVHDDEEGHCSAELPGESFKDDFVALSGFYIVWRFFRMPAGATRAEVLAATHKYCSMPWQQAVEAVGENVNFERYCVWGSYVVQLASQGLKLDQKQFSIGLGDVGWPLGAVLVEVSKLAVPTRTCEYCLFGSGETVPGGAAQGRMHAKSENICVVCVALIFLLIVVFVTAIVHLFSKGAATSRIPLLLKSSAAKPLLPLIKSYSNLHD